MKTNTRSVPLDMLSVEQKERHIQISTHLQSITVMLFENTAYIDSGSFTFDRFHEALRRICQEAAEAPQEPSPLSCTDSDGKTPCRAVTEPETDGSGDGVTFRTGLQP